jgi:hypothetical protein
MRRIPYARVKTVVKLAYDLPGITTGAVLDACAKRRKIINRY